MSHWTKILIWWKDFKKKWETLIFKQKRRWNGWNQSLQNSGIQNYWIIRWFFWQQILSWLMSTIFSSSCLLFSSSKVDMATWVDGRERERPRGRDASYILCHQISYFFLLRLDSVTWPVPQASIALHWRSEIIMFIKNTDLVLTPAPFLYLFLAAFLDAIRGCVRLSVRRSRLNWIDFSLFRCAAASLQEGVSVHWSVLWSVQWSVRQSVGPLHTS